MLRRWTKDYFTSCLDSQQRGVAPSLPLTGVLPVDLSALHTGAVGGLTFSSSPDIISLVDTTNYLSWWESIGAQVNLSDAATFNVADLRRVVQLQDFLEVNARCGVRYTEFLKGHFYGVAPRDERLQRAEYLGGSRAPLIVSKFSKLLKLLLAPALHLKEIWPVMVFLLLAAIILIILSKNLD